MKKERSPKITQFINLQSDYGFKRTFGNERFTGAVIRFLQAALGDQIHISKVEPHKVEYHDKEVLPDDTDGKRIIYDVYFTVEVSPFDSFFKPRHLGKEKNGEDVIHHFILEMQNIYEPPFEDRMTYYAAKMVAEQGAGGWNYDLDPVILIGITDFDFPHLTKQPVQEFELREKITGETLTRKIRILFYSLKHVPLQWDDCVTDLQKVLYLIKNMDKMDKNSKPYKDMEYEDFFNAAETADMAAEDIVLYSQSLSRLRSIQAGLDYRFEEGREEGRRSGMEDVARMLKADGADTGYISKITGLSPEQIMNI